MKYPLKAKYYFFGFAPSGRAEFGIISNDGDGSEQEVLFASWTIPEVYKNLINQGVQAVNMSKPDVPPPKGFPPKRW